MTRNLSNIQGAALVNATRTILQGADKTLSPWDFTVVADIEALRDTDDR